MNLFFLQAEDGIRDYKVTGVQTCALPISYRRADVRRRPAGAPGFLGDQPRGVAQDVRGQPAFALLPGQGGRARSEERRVGKEGDARSSRGRDRAQTASSEGR